MASFQIAVFSGRQGEWIDVARLLRDDGTMEVVDAALDHHAHVRDLLDDLRTILLGERWPLPHPPTAHSPFVLHSFHALPALPGGRQVYSALYCSDTGGGAPVFVPFQVVAPVGCAQLAREATRRLMRDVHHTDPAWTASDEVLGIW